MIISGIDWTSYHFQNFLIVQMQTVGTGLCVTDFKSMTSLGWQDFGLRLAAIGICNTDEMLGAWQ